MYKRQKQKVNQPTQALNDVIQQKAYKEESGNGDLLVADSNVSRHGLLTHIISNQVRIQPGTAAGDETVHCGAGRYATGVQENIALNIKEDHADIMNSKEVNYSVKCFIKTMLRNFAQCDFTN